MRLPAPCVMDFDDRVEVLSPPFSAWDVKGLCAHLDGVLTGRMHLAIAALGTGTPPLSVAYRGKFEGLMRHIGLDGGLIAPEAFLDCSHTVTVLEAFTRDLPNRRARSFRACPRCARSHNVNSIGSVRFDDVQWMPKVGGAGPMRFISADQLAPAYDVVLVGTGFGSLFFAHKLLDRLPVTSKLLFLERGAYRDHAQRLRDGPRAGTRASDYVEIKDPRRRPGNLPSGSVAERSAGGGRAPVSTRAHSH